MADVRTQVWRKKLAENLYPDDSYMVKSVDLSKDVSNHMINLSTAPLPPNVVKNRVGDGVAVERPAVADIFQIDEYTTDPEKIRSKSETETAFSYRLSMIENHKKALAEQIANNMAFNWAPVASANQVRTSGDAREAIVAGATGNRKKITLADLIKVKIAFNKANIPQKGRCLLLDPEMYEDLMADEAVDQKRVEEKERLIDGVLGRLKGFDIMMRSTVVSYTNAATPVKRDPSAAALGTANGAAIAWHPDFVCRAVGQTEVFDDKRNPLIYGDVHSTLARAGGHFIYKDQKGVMAIIEAASA